MRAHFQSQLGCALAPQILAEFIHVVTDPRRFSSPLNLEQAVERAAIWWNAAEVVHVFPSAESTLLFLGWLEEHRLGRQRLRDTMLASTLQAGGVTSMLTLNPDDLGCLETFRSPDDETWVGNRWRRRLAQPWAV